MEIYMEVFYGIVPPEDRMGAERLFAEARVGNDNGPLRFAALLVSLPCLSDNIGAVASLPYQ